jgi:hypothetical protein
MSQNILSANTPNVIEKVKYGDVKVASTGMKTIPILNVNNNMNVRMSTPLIRCYGINENDFEGNGNVKYDMSIQFQDNNNTRTFLDNMIAYENKIKEDAIKYSKEWFGKSKMSPEVVDALWSPMLKYPKNKETGEPDMTRLPTLKIKIPFWEGKCKANIYNTRKELVYPVNSDDDEEEPQLSSFITKQSHVMLIIQSGGIWCANGKFGTTGGIWCANGKFGTTWRLHQCMVEDTEEEGCLIVEDTEEEGCLIQVSNDDLKQFRNVSSEPKPTQAEDSDDEENTEVPSVTSGGPEDVAAEEPVSEVSAEEPVSEVTEEPKKKRTVRKKKETN